MPNPPSRLGHGGNRRASPASQVKVTPLDTQTFEFKRPGDKPAAPEPSIPKSAVELDSSLIAVDLLSNFRFYDFKTLALRPLKASSLAKFTRAYQEGKLRHTVDAISACLEPGRSAYDLTPNDFYYLEYWERVNSYKKFPLIHTSYCEDKQHNIDVVKKVKPDSSLEIKTILDKTTLETVFLDDLDLSPFQDFIDKYGLGVETMRDVVEAQETLMDVEKGNEELEWQAGYAAFIKPRFAGQTLIQRSKIVDEMDPDEIVIFDQYIAAVTNYGVSEFAVVKCKECGASKKVAIPLDALSFLPQHVL